MCWRRTKVGFPRPATLAPGRLPSHSGCGDSRPDRDMCGPQPSPSIDMIGCDANCNKVAVYEYRTTTKR